MDFDLQSTFRGETTELRPLHAEDDDALFAVASDPLVWEQHPVKDRCTEAGFRPFFEESLASGGALVVIDRATGKIIGSSRYAGYDPESSEVEIGWTFLARSHWGGKTNGEIKRLMLDHAFQFVESVILLINPVNIRSQRAVEKIGGIRDGWRTDGTGRASFLYRIRRGQAAGYRE